MRTAEPLHLILTFVLVFLSGLPRVAAQSRAVSLAQIEKLVAIHAPDDLVAREIRTHGLSFTPSMKIVRQIEGSGAGKATVAALLERVPKATLEIQAPTGSRITVDAKDMGAIGAERRMVLVGVAADEHRISVKLDGYEPQDLTVALAANEYKRLPVELKWAGGYLTVKVTPPGAAIDVPGLGQYRDGISNVPCPLGDYEADVTLVGMKTQVQRFHVVAGQHVDLDVILAPDPEFVRNGLLEARQRMDRGDTRGAIQLAQRLLAVRLGDSSTEAFLAEAYFATRDYGDFRTYAIQAVDGGGKVTFALYHEHVGLSGDEMHPAVLTLSSKAIAYDPDASTCKYRAFTAPISDIQKVEVSNQPQSGMFVVHHIAPGTYLMHLEIRDPEKPSGKRPASFSFAVRESRILNERGATILSSPPSSQQELSAIAEVIQSAIRARGR